jgi:hypothetical protein
MTQRLAMFVLDFRHHLPGRDRDGLSHAARRVGEPAHPAGEAVWWYEKDKFEQRFYGHHGGLTPQEMEIPLLACGR